MHTNVYLGNYITPMCEVIGRFSCSIVAFFLKQYTGYIVMLLPHDLQLFILYFAHDIAVLLK